MESRPLNLTCPRPTPIAGVCLHCGNPTQKSSDSRFCCAGCESVYSWIRDRQLGKYYDLKEKLSSKRPADQTQRLAPESFAYLDQADSLAIYTWPTPEGRRMDFFIEGVHCAACIWLIEKISVVVEHVDSVHLNLGNSTATVQIGEGGSFAEVALAIQKMGYRPHPVVPGTLNDLSQKESRRSLIRLGVAGACSGNIMLLAVSLYGGAQGALAERFRWISLGLYLPVVLYSAIPLYRSAWSSLKWRRLSIDVPVVFGILLGSIVSFFNLLVGDERVYFDSLSALVFLLLSTRHLLLKAQQASADSANLSHFFSPTRVRKWVLTQNQFVEVRLEEILTGDRVQVLPGESVPVDGIIVKGNSTLDCARLTGESHPIEAKLGTLAFAGTWNLESPLELEVTQCGAKTRMGRILTATERLMGEKASITQFADRVARYFVTAVVVLSGVTFAWGFHGNWIVGMNRALAVAIVTCPCTFALITPLVLSMTLGRLARAGVLVKGPEVLEKIAQVRSVFLDKTGTLTIGKPEVESCFIATDLQPSVLALESSSTHPVAKTLVRYLRPRVFGILPKFEQIHETMGMGIRGISLGNKLEIRRAAHSQGAGTEIEVFWNEIPQGRMVLNDQLRPNSPEAIAKLRSIGLNPWILSGDQSGPVNAVANQVGVDQNRRLANASPEMKGQAIAQGDHPLMVGDGVNDALALAQAYVGVAVHGGVEISLRAADVYLSVPGVQPVYELIVIARETLRVVHRNLGFSILYNLVAGGFALAGKIDPLLAAILMPLSALTVFLSSIAGTSKMRSAFRGLKP